ncbi:MAG: hypothetical protein ABII22_06905 [Candidatus Micrarchaeota archaeon]
MKKIMLILLISFFIFGCNSKDILDTEQLTGKSTVTTPEEGAISNPSSNLAVQSFNIYKKSGNPNYFVYFLIYDNDKKGYVRTDANVELSISDKDGILYEESRKVRKTEFGNENQVNFEIDASKIKKTVYDKVNAKITLKFQGNEYSAEKQVYDLQKYSDQELNQMMEEQYQKDKKDLNQKLSVGNFEVSIKSAGLYYGGEYLRIDLEVNNMGDEVFPFHLTEMKLLVNEDQLKYGGREGQLKETTSYYQLGETKTGYVYFYVDEEGEFPETVELQITGNYLDMGRNEQKETKKIGLDLRR